MWQWLQSNIFQPIASFFSRIATFVRSFFISNPHPQHQPIQQDLNKTLDAEKSTQPETTIPIETNQTPPTTEISTPSTNAITQSLKTTATQELTRITDLPLDVFISAMPKVVSDSDVSAIMGLLSSTSKERHQFFKEALSKRALNRAIKKQLWQAFIDDERGVFIKLATKKPEILFELMTSGAPKNFTIESKWTFQAFNLENENLFTIAVKRKALMMLKILLTTCCSFFKNDALRYPAIQEAKNAALKKWRYYDTTIDNNGNIKIVLPEKHVAEAERLIALFRKELQSQEDSHEKKKLNALFKKKNRTEELVDIITEEIDESKLTKRIESELTALSNKLIPLKAIKLDNDEDFEIELFLAALYQAYNKHFGKNERLHTSFRLMDVVSIRLIGLIQSVILPEMAKVLCAGLTDKNIVKAMKNVDELKISNNATQHRMRDGSSFYRVTRDSRKGMGFDWLCTENGLPGKGDSFSGSEPAYFNCYLVYREMDFMKHKLVISQENMITNSSHSPKPSSNR